LVKSLARPGRYITGVFFDFPDFRDFRKKWLALTKEALPQLAKIGVLGTRQPALRLYAVESD
jgi:hypothetical protein